MITRPTRISMLPRMRGAAAIGLALLLLFGSKIRAAESSGMCSLEEQGAGADRRIVIQNAFVRATIRPSQGGRVESFIHLRSSKELTLPLGESSPGGLLSDGLWQQDYGNGD